jgi:hypothetical protein
MTTPPAPEPSGPGEPGPDEPADRSAEEPVQPPSSPIEPPASAVRLGRDAEAEPERAPEWAPEPESLPESSAAPSSEASAQPARPAQPAQPAPDEQFPQYPPAPPLPPEAYPTYSGGQGYEYGGYGAPPIRRRNGMGVAALVLGIVGFLVGPCSVLAIVFGRIGLNRVARGEATNRGVAQAGFVLGIVTLLLWILGLILVANQH